MSTRVPAWKRLGLKLKYAKEAPDTEQLPSSSPSQQNNIKDTRLELGDLDTRSRPTKRRRLNVDESSQSQDSQRTVNGHHNHETNGQTSHAARPSGDAAVDSQLERQSKHVSASGKRKSVSFADTELVGNHDMQMNGDTTSSTSGQSSKDISRSSKRVREQATTTVPSSTNHVTETEDVAELSEPTELPQPLGPVGKAAKKRKSQQMGSGKKPVAALDYLKQHYEDRESWKFNKNRDIWILNHAQDEEAIPRSYDLSLAGYVHGLPENAASRSRLVDECKKKLESSGASITGLAAERLKEQFLDILQNDDKRSGEETFLDQIKTIQRSMLLLWSLGVHEPLAVSKPRPNKKSRTSAPIDISSSDTSDAESDSESDTSSSSSDSDTTEKTKSKRATKELNGGTSTSSNAEEVTSSSGSDTSSDSD